MNKNRIKIFFIAAGLLDLFSLYRNYRAAFVIIKTFHFDPLWIADLCLIISLAFSAVLLLLQKKSGLILYYFQFPLRLYFSVLTFGFINSFLLYGGPLSKVIFAFVIGLETVRLLVTILAQRK